MFMHKLPPVCRFEKNKRLSAAYLDYFAIPQETDFRVIGGYAYVTKDIDFQIPYFVICIRNRAKEGRLGLVGARDVLTVEVTRPKFGELVAIKMNGLKALDIGRLNVALDGLYYFADLSLRLGGGSICYTLIVLSFTGACDRNE
jgi:hypothetical protein